MVSSPDIKPILPYSTAATVSSTALGIIPSVSLSGLTGITDTGVYNDLDHNQNVFGSVTKTLGVHTFKAGATFQSLLQT